MISLNSLDVCKTIRSRIAGRIFVVFYYDIKSLSLIGQLRSQCMQQVNSFLFSGRRPVSRILEEDEAAVLPILVPSEAGFEEKRRFDVHEAEIGAAFLQARR